MALVMALHDFVYDWVAKLMDDLPLDITAIRLSPAGDLVATCNSPMRDSTWGVYYPSLDE